MTVVICLAVALAVAIMTCGILYERWVDAAASRDRWHNWHDAEAARADRAEAELASTRLELNLTRAGLGADYRLTPDGRVVPKGGSSTAPPVNGHRQGETL